MKKTATGQIRIMLLVTAILLGTLAFTAYAATSQPAEKCGGCAAGSGEGETGHSCDASCTEHGASIGSDEDKACSIPTCHVCNESCEINGCTHEHTAACVDIYRDAVMAWVDEACVHECTSGCSVNDCAHGHGATCFDASAEDLGNKCTDDLSDKCIDLLELVQHPCDHECGDLCELDGCDHACSDVCVDAFFSELENLNLL